MRTILRQSIANSQRRETFLMERRIRLTQNQEGEAEKTQDKEDKVKKITSGQKG